MSNPHFIIIIICFNNKFVGVTAVNAQHCRKQIKEVSLQVAGCKAATTAKRLVAPQ